MNQQAQHRSIVADRAALPARARWAAYMMCAWSLLFACLHFASNQGVQVEPLAWVLCAGILCVIGAVVALALIQSRKQRFPRWFMRASSLGGSALVFIYVLFSFLVNGFYWALAPGVLCVVG